MIFTWQTCLRVWFRAGRRPSGDCDSEQHRNHYSPTLIVAAVTAQKEKKAGQPTHYLLRDNPALSRSSVVLLEQLRTIDKNRIQRYLGKIDQTEMQKIDSALLTSLGLKSISSVKTMAERLKALPILLQMMFSE